MPALFAAKPLPTLRAVLVPLLVPAVVGFLFSTRSLLFLPSERAASSFPFPSLWQIRPPYFRPEVEQPDRGALLPSLERAVVFLSRAHFSVVRCSLFPRFSFLPTKKMFPPC